MLNHNRLCNGEGFNLTRTRGEEHLLDCDFYREKRTLEGNKIPERLGYVSLRLPRHFHLTLLPILPYPFIYLLFYSKLYQSFLIINS